MKIHLSHLTIFLLVLLAYSCSGDSNHFLKEKEYREEVHNQFLKRKEMTQNRENELFSVFDQDNLSVQEKEALEFLFAYMPLSDLADYNGEFYLKQVREALKTRDYFDWGKKIPDEVFRHFVLVHRVNTEDLDHARGEFFEELKDRVKGLSMEDAALEVNHWCHEKITYRATDGRTSAPLALAKTSWGRCGEQSTFTVMALRSAGIPARQCYTPRWVHTDSNHAWVEAWVDGKWRYMGASEPEAELDVAWFTAPAKRAMMVHTNVFGKYNGPEDKTSEKDLYSIINVLDTYASTREISIKVQNNKAVTEGATVKFEVYNYAQFTPIATLQTNKEGIVNLKTNTEGDLFVWANQGEKFAYKKIEQNETDITLELGDEIPVHEEIFRMNVPAEQSIKELSKEKIALNAIRLAYEDSIRNAYMATFISEEAAKELASKLQLDKDKVWTLLNKAQGNHKDIAEFITKEFKNPLLFDYLESLSEKDLRDTPAEYLSHHMDNGNALGIKEGTPKDLYAKYIYSPRISVELIRPWRTYIQDTFKDEVQAMQADPQKIVSYVRDSIKITNTENYYNCPISPRGVHELKLADTRSRNIYFVALCRSLGVASRLEPATSRPQYNEEGKWKDVFFEAQAKELPKGKITFIGDKNNIIKPSYGNHYTIAKMENGEYIPLNFRNDEALKDLPGTVEVDAGNYRLTIGTRANDGSVTAENRYFEVAEGKTIQEQITLPQPEGLIQVQGIVDPNTIVELDKDKKATLKELMNGKGLMLIFADPDKEPTKHILQDLPNVKDALNSWGGGILFLVPDDKLSVAFDSKAFNNLPDNSVWGVDKGRSILNATADALQIDFSNNFPLVIYLNNNGGILFSSQGYRIGIGENIIQTIEKEKATMK